MPSTSPKLGLRYPVASDAPDGAGAFFNLVTDLDALVIDATIGSGIGTAGTVVNFNSAIYTRARRTLGGLVTLAVGLNVGSSGVAVGGSLIQLPANMKPPATVPFIATLFDQPTGAGWAGVAANMTVESNGIVYFQGLTGGSSTGTIAASKGVFAAVAFQAA